jgi:hypothetical protein
MPKFWRNKYIQYTIAFLAAFFSILLPKWEHEKIDSPSPRFLAGDTISCTVLIKNSLGSKGHSLGYLYEIFSHFDQAQMCKTVINPEQEGFASWVRLSTENTDILVINSARDSVPEIFQEEVVSSIPINRSEEVCVVNKNHYMIVQVFNSWFTYFKQTPQYSEIASRYFKTYKSLSPYDNTIKEHSRILGWDWRLLASLIYQESKFKAGVSSSRGAIGVMQIKEAVAKYYGVDDIYNPHENIKAGTRHLKRLQNMYRKMGADSLNSTLIAIAAYNCGEGRMADCMTITRQVGKNHLVWEDIKASIPLLREEEYFKSESIKLGKFKGKETLKYVDSILERFHEYQKSVTAQ